MQTTLEERKISDILFALKEANEANKVIHPGESEARQPVSTMYGGAHLFKSTTATKMGELALKSLKANASNGKELKAALGMQCNDEVAEQVFKRVEEKLTREALEDFRIDFEDGFGNRPDQEEDETAVRAATEVAKGMVENTLPPFIGIRIKPFNEDLKVRSIRTLDIFLSTLSHETKGKLPNGFVVTLPKVTAKEQITALIDLFEMLEQNTELEKGSLKMEFMVETPESILGPQGEVVLLDYVKAAKGRCLGAHFGTYDYTASMNIIAEYQAMDHSACDFARSFMKVALAGTGVWLSDGATNIMPVGDQKAVHDAWKLSYSHIRHSLFNGIYQGWDLHPAQFPVRYAALYTFFLEGLESTTERLRNFIETAAKATLSGDVFDDAATGQGLLNFFLRGLNSGAITMEEVKKTGLSYEEIQTRSFYRILEGRNKL
jgi:citrate lyase beta subunit